MERDLNISLIAGIILTNLPVWQWESRMQFLGGTLVLTLVTMMLIAWLKDKRPKKKSPTAATARLK